MRPLLMHEPRGHGAMSGAILQPPTRADADWGVLFIEVCGCLPMCGHGTIGVATVLVETGMVEVTEPVTEVRLDTPAGPGRRARGGRGRRARGGDDPQRPGVRARPRPRGRRARPREVTYDMAFGGNFYAIVELAELGLPVRPGARRRAPRRRPGDHGRDQRGGPAGAPGGRRIAGCHHVLPRRARSRRRHSRHAMAIHPGWFDRSPCGTGTSRAPGAAARTRRDAAAGEDFVNESFIGTRFTGRIVEETTVGGLPAVVPRSPAAPGSPAWASTCSTPTTLSHRLSPRVSSPDVVVIGAGIVGVSTAWELVQRGASVTVVDRAGISEGTTGLGEGNVLAGDKDAGPELELTRLGLDVYAEIEARLGDVARIRRKGALIVHPDERTWAAEPERVEGLGAAGVEAELVTPEEARELEPELTGEIHGATFVPGDLQCDPRAITRALAAQLGERVRTGATVES